MYIYSFLRTSQSDPFPVVPIAPSRDPPLDHELGKGDLSVPVQVHLLDALARLLLLVGHRSHPSDDL